MGQESACQKLQQDLKSENLSDHMVMEEYFERDVKFEVDSTFNLERSTKLKHESLCDKDDRLEEYFEKEVKSEVDFDIENRINNRIIASNSTTPDSLRIHELINEMILDDCQICFMEVSSHAIHQKRVENLKFDGGIFTNITHEHLDYHKNFKEYISVKKKFFDDLDSSAFAITNIDDKNGRTMLLNTKARKLTFSLKSMADYRCKILESSLDGMLLKIQNIQVWVNIIGEFKKFPKKISSYGCS